MCIPIVAGVMLAGSAMSAMGKAQEGQAAADAAEYNIALGEIQASDAMSQAEDEKQQLAHQFLKEKGAGQVETAGSNIRLGTGSSLDWENDLIETYISDKAGIDENTGRAIYGIRNQQKLDAMQGESAKKAGQIGAGGSLLAGAGQAAGQWYTPS